MTVWETVERGEYVEIALAVIAIVTLVIWWVRSAKLSRQKKSYPDMMQRVRDYVVEGDLENAGQICESYDTPGAVVVSAGLNYVGSQMTDLKSAMQSVAQIEKDKLQKGQRWLRFFAVISPLIGLGGTLVGIVDRLRDFGDSGISVDASVLAGSIAPSIVTTVAGLVVGIFALLANTCLDATVASSRMGIDEVSLEFTNLLNEPS